MNPSIYLVVLMALVATASPCVAQNLPVPPAAPPAPQPMPSPVKPVEPEMEGAKEEAEERAFHLAEQKRKIEYENAEMATSRAAKARSEPRGQVGLWRVGAQPRALPLVIGGRPNSSHVRSAGKAKTKTSLHQKAKPKDGKRKNVPPAHDSLPVPTRR